MLDTRVYFDRRILDNYADLLALAGQVAASAPCMYCAPDSPPRPPDALWMLDHPTDENQPAGLLCARHTAEWCATGTVIPDSPPAEARA